MKPCSDPQCDIAGGGSSAAVRSQKNSMTNTIYESNYVIAFSGKNERLKILKDRDGLNQKDELNKSEGITLLVELIARQAFVDSSGLGIYEDMLRRELMKDVNKLLDKFEVKEKNFDNIRAESRGDGATGRYGEGPVFISR